MLRLILFTGIICAHVGNGVPTCLPRNEYYATTYEGRAKCRKACESDSDCRGVKRCLCDGYCGKSCYNPDANCPAPSPLENGRIRGLADGELATVGRKIYYRCNDGYSLQGKDLRTCHPDRKWSFEEPTCVRGCQFPRNINNAYANTYLTEYRVNTTVTYKCLNGYYGTGDGSVTCQRNFEWTRMRLRCSIKSCPPLEAPNNGRLKFGRRGMQFAASVEVVCNTGYSKSHNIEVFCNDKEKESVYGTWDGTLAECNINKCESPPYINNGRIANRRVEYEYGDFVSYTCNVGFKMIGNARSTCQANTTWSLTPSCEVDLNCDFETYSQPFCGFEVAPTDSWQRKYDRNSFQDGNYVARSNVYNSYMVSMLADYLPNTCVKFGYKISSTSGYVTIEEATTGTELYRSLTKESRYIWHNVSSVVPNREGQFQIKLSVKDGVADLDDVRITQVDCVDRCSESPCNDGTCVNRMNGYSCFCTQYFTGVNCEKDLRCPIPSQSITNGKLITNVVNRMPHAIAKYACEDGFMFSKTKSYYGGITVVKEKVVTCGIDSSWSPSISTISCEEILCHEVGDIAHGRIVQNGRAIGSRMTFECDEGYKLSTTYSTITCDSNGEWSVPGPRCHRIPCPAPPSLPNGLKRLSAGTRHAGDVETLQCLDGYIDSGENQIKCQLNGQWSDVQLTCTRRQYASCSHPMHSLTLKLYSNMNTNKEERSNRSWAHGESATFKCRYNPLHQIRGSSNIKCMNGYWSDLVPECIEKSFPFNNTFNSIQYIAPKDAPRDNWENQQIRCKILGGNLPMILNEDTQVHLKPFFESLGNLLHTKYWLGAKYKGRSWKWIDEEETPVVYSEWRNKVSKPNITHACPVIGKKLCAGSGTYCWSPHTQCKRKSPLVCERDANPCHSTPCHNQGSCVRVDNNDYRCECDEAHFYGTNCERRRFCTAFESLPDDLIALKAGSELFHGVRIWPLQTRLGLQCADPSASLELNSEMTCTGDGWSELELYTCRIDLTTSTQASTIQATTTRSTTQTTTRRIARTTISTTSRSNMRYCPTPLISNGFMVKESFPVDDYYKYQCNEGFERPTFSIWMYCMKSGRWSTVGLCRRTHCSTPQISNGNMDEETFSLNRWHKFHCDEGYKPTVSHAHMYCNHNGEWKTIEACERNYRMQLPRTSPAPTTTRSTTIRTTTSTTSKPSSKAIEPDIPVDSVSWNSECRCPEITNGSMVKDRFPANDYYKYVCNEGFKPSGDGYIRCDTHGEWDKMAICERNPCNVPQTPPHVNFTNIGIESPLKTEIVINCDAGYRLVPGTSLYNIICSEDGVWKLGNEDTLWTREYNACTEMGCSISLLSIPLHMIVEGMEGEAFRQYNHDDQVVLSCENNPHFRETITCDKGKWIERSYTNYTCEEPTPQFSTLPSTTSTTTIISQPITEATTTTTEPTDSCPKPSTPENTKPFDKNKPDGKTYNIGATLKVKCKKNYKATLSTIECTEGGIWIASGLGSQWTEEYEACSLPASTEPDLSTTEIAVEP